MGKIEENGRRKKRRRVLGYDRFVKTIGHFRFKCIKRGLSLAFFRIYE